MLKLIFAVTKISLLVIFLSLLCLHFVIKDRYFFTGIIFYSTPFPLVLAFGYFINLLFYKTKKVLVFLALLNIGLTIYFFAHYFGSIHKPLDGKIHTALFWNVAQNQPLPTGTLIKNIKSTNSDIVALVEAVNVSNEDLDILSNALPEYQFRPLYGTMLVGVRGHIETIKFKAKNSVYKLNHITALIDGEKKNIVIIDINAVPMIDKAISIGYIDSYLQKHRADIILGDFNTPYESIFLDAFKSDYKSLHPYSIGMTSTWPLPFPVIEIDQIWLERSYQPIQLKKYAFPESDHKLLVAFYQKKSEAP